jgi:hypothetical protein
MVLTHGAKTRYAVGGGWGPRRGALGNERATAHASLLHRCLSTLRDLVGAFTDASHGCRAVSDSSVRWSASLTAIAWRPASPYSAAEGRRRHFESVPP